MTINLLLVAHIRVLNTFHLRFPINKDNFLSDLEKLEHIVKYNQHHLSCNRLHA